MTSRRFLRVLGGIVGGLMLLAPSAMAANHYISPAGYTTEVHLRGSHGYRIEVSTGSRHGVSIDVHRGGARTEYSVQGIENGKYGAIARFPGLGQVRFHFVPNGRAHRVPPPPWCEGPGGWLIDGLVRGRIRFVGEDGYTRVAVRRAKATVETWPKTRCRVLELGKGPRKWTAVFSAFREIPPNIDFVAVFYARRSHPSSKRVIFQAHGGFSRGPVAIFRSASVTADASSFTLLSPKSAPENVTLAPPPPFSGTGTFQRNSESVFTWEGDLSVRFPGAAPLALAGPAFNTRYCALHGCVDQSSSLFP